ncbi:ABC transporter substrate-binding protein [Roseomonas sp. CCTCC AB2023176]|uniref:ABC transporter substrate-binding protein n=1 Tax=Roseomonas sp. CCTCC AB2023176 TaxID=3342640 RepID=UPI0035DFE6B8
MIRRRDLLLTAAALPAAPAIAQNTAARTLRVIPQANLTSLDPVWTTAVVTRNHAYLVYDQLCAVDAVGTPRPQMASWEIGDDGKSWTFALRDGLRFHDSQPVRAADCVASIRRWAARDTFGQALWAQVDELAALDDRRFRFRLKKPFPFLALAMGKSQNPCFVMPERVASTDPFQQVRDASGSGPFRFVQGEWNPGQRAVWTRFEGYQPRQEPPDGLAGGRVPRLDRIEWTVISDSATAASALVTGEQDYWEYPLHDLLPLLRRSRDVVVEQRLLEGTYGVARFNHLHPPFDKLAVRRAFAMGVDQRDYLRAVAGEDAQAWGVCEGVFTCGSALASEQGNDVMKVRNLDRARAALRESGYAGEKVVLLTPSDYPQINALSLVTADVLRRMGFNLEVVATDWGTLVQRRASREPVDRGGWSIIHTTSSGTDLGVPTIHLFLRANGANAWFGWPTDDRIETLRTAWLDAPDEASSRRIGAELNARAMEVLPYVPLGYYWQPSAWRRNVTGAFKAPATVFWNIAKG